MLEFYEFNTFNICVVLISTFVIYYILFNFIMNNTEEKKSNDEFSLEYLIISLIISVLISIGISYIMSSGDEALLTENYWENSTFE